jgi:cytochrome c peroxidase
MRVLSVALVGAVLGCGSHPPPAGGPNDPAPVLTPDQRAALASLSPASLPLLPDLSNRFADDPAAAALGQKLFFDPSFSGVLWEGDNDEPGSGGLGHVGDTGKVACAGCHTATGAFADDRSTGNSHHSVSLAAGWTMRRAPSLLDVAQTKLVMWDGRKDSLYAQVFGPIEARNEMNTSPLFVAERIFASYRAEYEAVFGPMPQLDDASVFPVLTNATTGCQKTGVGSNDFACHGVPGDGAEYDHLTASAKDAVTGVIVGMGKAIAAYERLLSCGQGRFDAWMHGDASAMSLAEQRGAGLFVGKAGCVKCHAGPFLSDQSFHNTGLIAEAVVVVIIDSDDPGESAGIPQALADPVNTKSKWSDGDDGRLPASVTPAMLGAFKTPMLRCVAKHPSFMHTGQLQTLEQVVDFFAQGGGQVHGYLGTSELVTLDLSDQDKSDLVAFLRALDGPGPQPELTH